MNWRERISVDPQVCHGELCARGTRVFVTNILDSLAEGATRKEILGNCRMADDSSAPKDAVNLNNLDDWYEFHKAVFQ